MLYMYLIEFKTLIEFVTLKNSAGHKNHSLGCALRGCTGSNLLSIIYVAVPKIFKEQI